MPLQPAQSLSSELSGARIIGSQSTHGAAPLTPGCGCGCGCVHTTPTRMWVWMWVCPHNSHQDVGVDAHCMYVLQNFALCTLGAFPSPPLPQVAKYGHIRHGELLIRYGADLNAQNSVGNTPLHVAASYAQVTAVHTPCSRILCPGNSSAHSM